MKWPWKSTEKRNDSYTDALVSLLQQGAGGGTGASVAATGALEASCGLVQRCFSGSANIRTGSRCPGARAWDSGTDRQGSNPHRRSGLLSGRTGWPLDLTPCSIVGHFRVCSPFDLDLSADTCRAGCNDNRGPGASGWCASFSLCNRPVKAVSWDSSTDKRITRWKAISRNRKGTWR